MSDARALGRDRMRYAPPFESLLAGLPEEQADTLRALLRERSHTEALGEVARAVNGSLRLDEVLDLTLRHTMALIGADGAGVMLKRGDELEIVAAIGAARSLLGRRMPIDGSLNGTAIRDGSPIISNDVPNDTRFHRPVAALTDITRSMIAPMITARGAIGTLAVMNRGAAYGEEDVRVLQGLADQVAVAIVNAQLFEEVERARREWEAAFDAAAVGMVVLDGEARIRRCNARALALACVAHPEALLGRQFHDAILHLEAPPEGSPVRHALERALVWRAVVPASTRGLIFDVVASPHPEGGAVVTFDDVTSYHHLAERHRRVVETSSDAIVITDPSRRIAFANPAAAELFGYAADHLMGMPVDDLVLAEVREEVAGHERAALHGLRRRYETIIVRADGQRRTVEVSTAPLRDVGEITGVVASLRDVTEAREARDAMLRSEARYARLLESASDGIFTVDEGGAFVSVNRSLERSVGRAAADLIGTSFVELVEEDDRAIMQSVFDGTIRGERQRAEMRFRDARGLLRTGSITMTPIVADGRVTGALGVVRDVTEERRLTEQLLQREKLAAVGQLVSGVAHELNNPLAGIAAFSQLLLAASFGSPEQQDALATINKEARRAGKIVSNLLLFARQRHPERGLTDLNQVILDTLELRRYVLHNEAITVVTDLDPELPITWADSFQLQQVFLNLLTNAEHAVRSARGEKRIVLRTRARGERLVASVEDSGPGIPRDVLDRIFNPFYTTKPVGEGTGLGLSISDGIVREHGGQITVRSSPHAGAVFDVELPLAHPPENGGATLASRSLSGGAD